MFRDASPPAPTRSFDAIVLALALACVVVPSSAATAPASLRTAADVDGAWAEHGTLADSFYPTWYDAGGDRLVTLGDWNPGARTLPLGGAAGWQPLRGMPPNVSPSYGNTGIDAAVNEAYVFQYDPALMLVWHVVVGTTATAAPLPATGTPPSPRGDALARFDPASRRLFVVGGTDPSSYSDDRHTYMLQLDPSPAWSTLDIPGPDFGPYTDASFDAILDATRHRLVLFGFAPDSFWTLSTDAPTAWVGAAATFPAGTQPYQPAYNGLVADPGADRVLAVDATGQPWAFSLAQGAWAPLAGAGPVPSPHHYAALALDPVRHRLLMNGGRTAASVFNPTSDLWSLALAGPAAWTQLVADVPRPSIRYGASAGYDPSRDRIVVTGGSGINRYPPFGDATWTLALGPEPAWSPLPTAGTAPYYAAAFVTAYDPVRDQMLFFGSAGDITALSFAVTPPTWSAITPAGPAPSARSNPSVVYDAARDRFLYMFGTSGTGFLADVWELRLAPAPAWRQLAPSGAGPSARRSAMALCDPVNDRVVVFGGVSLPDTLPADTWSLALSPGDGAWQQLALATAPSGRQGAIFCLDALRQRALLFGGYGFTRQPPPANRYDFLDDTWALDLGGPPAWHALAPLGGLPAGRANGAGAYDAVNDRLVVSGGLLSGLFDTWTLGFCGQATGTGLALAFRDVAADHVTLVWEGGVPATSATAMRRSEGGTWAPLATLTCDGEGRFALTDRDVTPGARLEYGLRTGSGGAAIAAAVLVVVPAASLALRAAQTPDRGVRLALDLPGAGTARLALFDVAGRRLWARDLVATGAGTRELGVDGPRLGPGLYFARLTWGRETRTARVALVR